MEPKQFSSIGDRSTFESLVAALLVPVDTAPRGVGTDLDSTTSDGVLYLIGLDDVHLVTDGLGTTTANLLRSEMRERITCAAPAGYVLTSIGTDGFALVGKKMPEEPVVLAQNIVSTIRNEFIVDDEVIIAHASVGFARRLSNESINDLIWRADVAMHRIKSLGGNGFRCSSPTSEGYGSAVKLPIDVGHVALELERFAESLDDMVAEYEGSTAHDNVVPLMQASYGTHQALAGIRQLHPSATLRVHDVQ